MKKKLPDQKETDEELLLRIQTGSEEAMESIIHRYKPLVLARARSYFLAGGDREDLVQEGMIGLFKAVRDYQDDRNIRFSAFAEMCVVRQLITAVKTATRQKHMPLNSYISLSGHVFQDEKEKPVIDPALESVGANPEHRYIRNEEVTGMNLAVEQLLSEFERQVLALYLRGIAYTEISRMVGKPTKSVDNALQRIRKKIEQHIAGKKRLDQ